MKSGRLEQYWKYLTTEQAAIGIHAAITNSRALLADAALLLEHGRWQRGAALSILAIEEASKVEIIREIMVSNTTNELREAWRRYRSHTAKNVMFIFPDLVRQGARHLDEFSRIFDPKSEHPQILESVKQISIYSDCCGNCHWSEPDQVTNPELAKSLFSIAKLFVREGPIAYSSKEELDIWAKHMTPLWKGSADATKSALMACDAEARSKGVLQGSSTQEEMIDFLFGSKASKYSRNS